ncbi:hypothetical protein HZU77_006985 [Neisseriaceae bacterium TC5R-5]|nr:hypothetical protein [Neisseriaceae bacterium TC5R-5]
METDVITFNLAERGRRFTGKDRHFNLAAIAKLMNGPACQERVKNRDMMGYYGHWPRLKFGLEPREGGLYQGKALQLEPALITTYLKAYPDGTVEHKADFLETDPGKLAWRLHKSKAGGFSSAIDGNFSKFYGFDYVLEPNFSGNRGYVLDDVNSLSDDEVMTAIQNEQLHGALLLLDSVTMAHQLSSEALHRLQQENEQLLSLLASKGVNESDAALDSVAGASQSIRRLSCDKINLIQRDISHFPALPLENASPLRSETDTESLRHYQQIAKQYLRR